ncbi:MAG: 6-phosphofructokinase [Planctomycetales bacterium 4484_113]|nr:MAG: 6-phosphofructokinase [Planctomycetales bacterium 4484_113]
MRIGVLTGGGDSPGTNVALRALVLRAAKRDHQVVAFLDGWKGVLNGEFRELVPTDVRELIAVGGTIIGSSRTNPFNTEGGPELCIRQLREAKVDALITIGGDDTNGVAHRLAEHGVKVVGIPQTIDNDLGATDYSVGFHSALHTVTEALDRLRTTGHSHHRVMVCEIMGRDSGWLTLFGGLAGGADIILLPEEHFDIDTVCAELKRLHQEGADYSIVAVAEGAVPQELAGQVVEEEERDAFGHVRLGGIGKWLAQEIEKRTGLETRDVTLGHLQRGGPPTAAERVLATRMGIKAVGLCESGQFDMMVVVRGLEIGAVPMTEALQQNRMVPPELVHLNELLG